MAITTALDLREQVRIRLREGDLIDPYDIAREIATEMTDDELRELAAGLLANVVREQIHAERSRKGSASSSPRWEAVKRTRSRLDMPWAPGGEWKRLRDCTREDVEQLVADYAKRAEANAAWRDAFRRVADEMGRRKVGTVGELPVEFVEEVLP